MSGRSHYRQLLASAHKTHPTLHVRRTRCVLDKGSQTSKYYIIADIPNQRNSNFGFNRQKTADKYCIGHPRNALVLKHLKAHLVVACKKFNDSYFNI